VSDYFGALMRSSGLTVGPRRSVSHDGREPANLSQTAQLPTHADADDIVEIDEMRETGGTFLETTARYSQARDPGAVDRPGFVDREAAPGSPSFAAPRPEVRASGETVDVEQLQRAVIDAALRWVTSDAQTRPEPAGTERSARGAANDSLPLTERSTVTRAEMSAASPVSPRAIFARIGDDVSMAEIDFEPPSRPSSERTATSDQERSGSSRPVEEVVEVSIGSIHVHVDGPKAKPVHTKPAPRRSSEGRKPSSGSGLHRRYLRAI
jgi:hypothetical protein